MKSAKPITIAGFTTDPYKHIYGYALVFFRLFNFLDKNTDSDVQLFSNDGVCSTLIKNKKFHTFRMNKVSNIISKTIQQTRYFYQQSTALDKNAVIVVNCEIPELLFGSIMVMQNRLVLCIFQDNRTRKSDLVTTIICKIRIFLVRRMKYVLFTNKYTMKEEQGNFKSYYLGNPVFF